MNLTMAVKMYITIAMILEVNMMQAIGTIKCSEKVRTNVIAQIENYFERMVRLCGKIKR